MKNILYTIILSFLFSFSNVNAEKYSDAYNNYELLSIDWGYWLVVSLVALFFYAWEMFTIRIDTDTFIEKVRIRIKKFNTIEMIIIILFVGKEILFYQYPKTDQKLEAYISNCKEYFKNRLIDNNIAYFLFIALPFCSHFLSQHLHMQGQDLSSVFALIVYILGVWTLSYIILKFVMLSIYKMIFERLRTKKIMHWKIMANQTIKILRSRDRPFKKGTARYNMWMHIKEFDGKEVKELEESMKKSMPSQQKKEFGDHGWLRFFEREGMIELIEDAETDE
jgi:hypothetical protein